MGRKYRRRKRSVVGSAPNYVAKKSICQLFSKSGGRWGWKFLGVTALTAAWVAFCLLIFKINLLELYFNLVVLVPAVIYVFFALWFLIFKVWDLKKTRIEFYDERIVVRMGLLNQKEKVMLFMGVTEVQEERPLWGLIFGYGHVFISGVSNFNTKYTKYLKKPRQLKAFLNKHIISASETNRVVNIG